MFKTIYIALLSFFIISCSATGPKFTPVEMKSNNGLLIYVYRESVFCLSARSPDIYIDNAKIAALSNNGYIFKQVDPGSHYLEAKGLMDLSASSIQIETTKGKATYIKWIPKCGFLSWKLTLVEVPEEQALHEISDASLQN